MNEKQRAPETLRGRCATCKHWRGNHEVAQAQFKEIPESMALNGGWPNSGECEQGGAFLVVEVHGDAIAEVELDANFGCVWWTPQEDEDGGEPR